MRWERDFSSLDLVRTGYVCIIFVRCHGRDLCVCHISAYIFGVDKH
jgi:hypothetical protein